MILRADALLNSKPDSSQKLLLTQQHPEKLSKADYAAWCLLFTHSQYKLYQDIKSDSLIRVAVRYYDNSNLYKQSGTAYFLLGYILQQGKKDRDAMGAYKKAADLLKNTNEMKLNGLVNYNLGDMCMQDELYTQSLRYLNKSLYYYRITKNIHDQACVYVLISNICDILNYKHEIIMYYSNMALKLSKSTNDTSLQIGVLAQQGMFCYNTNYYRSKELILKGYRFFPDRRTDFAAYLSYEYSKLNKPDSARFYLNITLTDIKNKNDKTIRYLTSAYVAKDEGNLDKAFNFLEKAYLNRDTIFQHNYHSQLYRIDKQFDLSQKEKENAALKLANRNHIILIAFLLIGILISLLIALLIQNRYKRRQAEHAFVKQGMEYELKTMQIENNQKRELLLSKLQNRIENTLNFNRMKVGISHQEKQDAFMDEITKQAVIAEKEWTYYIDEVNQLFDGIIVRLQEKYTNLTQPDLIVIALICLKVDVSDCCNLLNMPKNTMYTRRKTIKKRIGIDKETDLEEWLMHYVEEVPENE